MGVDIHRAAMKMLPIFLEAKAAKLNEADTVQRVLRWFEDVLGYNPQTELSRELHRQGRFLDIAVKVNGKIQLIVEVKQAGTELSQRHIDQALRYANEFQIWWTVLTNGTHWVLYKFKASKTGVQPYVVVDVDLSDTETLDKSIEALSCLHRRIMTIEALEQLYERTQAASPKVIARALFNQDVLTKIAREIRKEKDVLFASEELKNILESMFSEEVADEISGMRIKKKKQKKVSVIADKNKIVSQTTIDTIGTVVDSIPVETVLSPEETILPSSILGNPKIEE